MTTSLSQTRLIYIAPRLGVGGVGDYAEHFLNAVRPLFADVVDYRHGAPGTDTIAELRRHRAAVRELIADAEPGKVIVHAELSGGALVPFYSIAGLPQDLPVTALIHDPPNPIWWPARTKFMADHKLVNHGLHFPLRKVSPLLERRVLAGRTLFVMTESGKRSLETDYPRSSSVLVPHMAAERPDIKPPQERPKAVGFFGLVYRGKGFEQIGLLRERLPDDIAIRVAGRGRETLPRTEGIEIVGAIDGPAEDAFFESVRAIAMPYGRRSPYGMGYPSSAVLAHAIAYGTPAICTDHGALGDLDEDSGVVVLRDLPEEPDAVADAFAHSIEELVNDEQRLTAVGRRVDAEREARAGHRVVDVFGRTWSAMLAARR